MAKSEKTSSRVATQSSKVLKDARASDRAKSLAGSALAQAGTKKQTSSGVARKAVLHPSPGKAARIFMKK